MPGSTFKLVTGLAGIAASKTVPWAGDVVVGREPPARQMAGSASARARSWSMG